MKKVKFGLNLNGIKIMNLLELEASFSAVELEADFIADILNRFQTGKLAKWLDETVNLRDKADAIKALAKNGSEPQQLSEICRVLGFKDRQRVFDEMMLTNVAKFATELGLPVNLLLEQLQSAGIPKHNDADTVSEADKTQLLGHLKKSHGADGGAKKITLARRSVS